VTDYGKIYRSLADDGPFSVWAFGSTSAVDTALDFDTHFNNAGHFPAAVFKFTSLELAGNPTIDLSNGGVTNLGLISVGDITSGLPGGTLTFSGIDALLLASQDGSINLGSEITFQGIPTLFFYARGTNGDLTLASPIVGTTDLFLYAGRNITFNAGTDLILGVDFSARSAGGNISVSESGDITVGGALSATTDVIANAATGGNITFTTGGSLSASNVDMQTTVEPGVTLNSGANIALNIGGDLTMNSGDLALTVDDSNGGHIGAGGNISVTTGGDLMADSVGVVINNGNGGQIDSAVSLTLNVQGALTTSQEGPNGDPSLGLVIFNRYDTASSLIDGDATLSLAADSAVIGGTFFPLIHNRGSTIGGNALMNINITDDLMVQGLANIWLINATGGTTNGSATVQIEAANISTGGDFSLLLDNSGGGSIGGDATINVNANSISTGGALDATIDNSNGGMIGGAANVAVNIDNNVTAPVGVTLQILNGNSGHIVTGADVLYSVGGTTSTTNLFEYIDNTNGGVIDNGGNVTLHTVGPVMLDGGLSLEVDNFNGGTINNGANVTAHFVGDVTATFGQFHSLNWFVLNGSGFFNPTATGGTIGTGGNIDVTFDGNASTTGTSNTGSFAAEIENGLGFIGTGGNISMTVAGNVTSGPLLVDIDNRGGHIGTGGNITFDVAGDVTAAAQAFFGVLNNGGSIGSGANVTLNLGGDLTAQTSAEFSILNNNNGSGSGGGTIGGNATVDVNLGNISSGPNPDFQFSLIVQINNGGGSIGGNAIVDFAALGNVDAQGNAFFQIVSSGAGSYIGGNALLNVSMGDFSTTGDLFARIYNDGGGFIGGDAKINFSANTISTGGSDPFPFAIQNLNGGHIVGDAEIDVTTGTLTANSTATTIDNKAGMIDSNALINLNVGGDINLQNTAIFAIFNDDGGIAGGGGTIGGDATINVGAASITANSLVAQIDNTGGSIGASTEGGATINMNVSGTATVTNDATVAIYGSDGAVGGAAINFNGGSYDAGGTFLAFTDGDGTITFNNASAHADVLKVGALGTNGVLNIGGGTLSADTTLKLYAGGSNGQLNFVSNVTLSSGTAMDLAANTITIQPSVLVTIAGTGGAANIYTNNANYSGPGGTNPSNGTFGGHGANDPQPLANAPAFDDPPPPATLTTTTSTTSTTVKSPTLSTTSGKTSTTVKSPTLSTTSGKTTRATINVSSSDQLLSLLDGATTDRDGKIRISDSQRTSNLKNLRGMNISALSRAERRMVIQQMRDRSSPRLRGAKRLL
jgi:hypothetical protein